MKFPFITNHNGERSTNRLELFALNHFVSNWTILHSKRFQINAYIYTALNG